MGIEETISPLRDNWASTRLDAVCHSQGGLLTRMLCSENTSRTLSRPFRNEVNHLETGPGSEIPSRSHHDPFRPAPLCGESSAFLPLN
jgi:hypothetical protein